MFIAHDRISAFPWITVTQTVWETHIASRPARVPTSSVNSSSPRASSANNHLLVKSFAACVLLTAKCNQYWGCFWLLPKAIYTAQNPSFFFFLSIYIGTCKYNHKSMCLAGSLREKPVESDLVSLSDHLFCCIVPFWLLSEHTYSSLTISFTV